VRRRAISESIFPPGTDTQGMIRSEETVFHKKFLVVLKRHAY
jgi:hypothetical protein